MQPEHQGRKPSTTRGVAGVIPDFLRKRWGLVLAFFFLVPLASYLVLESARPVHSAPRSGSPSLAVHQDTEGKTRANGLMTVRRTPSPPVATEALATRPISPPATEKAVNRLPTVWVQPGSREALLPRPDPQRYIRQGEFAVLLLMAMGVPSPERGWTGESATCCLAGDEDPGGDVVVALRRCLPFVDELRIRGNPAGREEEDLFGGWNGTPVHPDHGWQSETYLTEGEMVEILEGVGVSVFTNRPESLVTWGLAYRVLSKFHSLLEPDAKLHGPPFHSSRKIGMPSEHPAPRSAVSPFVP